MNAAPLSMSLYTGSSTLTFRQKENQLSSSNPLADFEYISKPYLTMSALQPLFQDLLVPLEDRPDLFKCTKLWFNDGSVVLQADNVLFKAYKGLLEKDSAIFHSMFSLKQSDNAEKINDVPLIHVSESPDDLHLLLLAVHDPR